MRKEKSANSETSQFFRQPLLGTQHRKEYRVAGNENFV